MGGLLEFLEQPVVAASAAALMVLGFLLAIVFFVRSSRARAARDAALAREQSVTRQFEAILGSARDGVVVVSARGDVAMITEAAASLLGLDRESSVGKPVLRLPLRAVDEYLRPLFPADVLAASSTTDPRLVGVPGRRGADDVRWIQVSSRVAEGALDGQDAVVVTITDTTGLREAVEALGRSDAQFRKAMENAPVGMALVDLEWRLMEVNRAFAEFMGSTVAALRGVPFSELSHEDDINAERDQLQRLYEGKQSHFSVEKRYVRTDGNVVWAVLDVSLVRYAGGAPDHYVVQVRDSTDDRMRSELLSHRAMHDPLTGLANRTLLQEILDQVLESADAMSRAGVIAVDLDGFKGLNDRFGHATGDTALVHVAGVLKTATAGRGVVARIGGDEFVIVVTSDDVSRAMFDIAGAIHAGLKRPLQVKRHHLNLRASIGIALATPATARGGALTLLSAADAAMYRAKAAGRGRTEVFDASMEVAADPSAALAGDFADAIENGDVMLHYQPIMDLRTRTVVGYEALVRWQHPTRGLLLPGAFLSLLEDRKIAVALGKALVLQAAEFLASSDSTTTWVSLNVSADQLGDSEFATTVLEAIATYHLSPQRIVVELTEASLVAPNTRVRHELTELRNAGVPILLDDFGTGVSPLSYLRDLPVSGVKLDMSFVAGIPEDPAGARVSRALGALARELGLATIAEGIETESQADFLARCGWRYGQGWLFGTPQPASLALRHGAEHTPSLIDPRPQERDDPFDLPPLAGDD